VEPTVPVDEPAVEPDAEQPTDESEVLEPEAEEPTTPDAQEPPTPSESEQPDEQETEQPELEPPAEPETPIALPATPQTEEPIIANPSIRELALENACVETCSLPALQGTNALVVEITGDVTVALDRIVWGTRGALTPADEVTIPVEPETPTNPEFNETNQTNQTNTTQPPNTTVPVFGDIGAPCSDATQCSSGVCVSSRFQGTDTQGLCAATVNACVAQDAVHEVGTVVLDSVCTQHDAGAAWLVRAGQGRFAIEASDRSLAGIIDKYGMMAVRGLAAFTTEPGTSGWLIKNSADVVTLSIDEAGSLQAAGALSTRTTPTRTGEGDFVIRTTDGVDAALITPAGDIMLRGELLTGAQVQ
jgi:hypothetical protein